MSFTKLPTATQIKTKFKFFLAILPKRIVWDFINCYCLNLFSFIFTLSADFSSNLFIACFFFAFVASSFFHLFFPFLVAKTASIMAFTDVSVSTFALPFFFPWSIFFLGGPGMWLYSFRCDYPISKMLQNHRA